LATIFMVSFSLTSVKALRHAGRETVFRHAVASAIAIMGGSESPRKQDAPQTQIK